MLICEQQNEFNEGKMNGMTALVPNNAGKPSAVNITEELENISDKHFLIVQDSVSLFDKVKGGC